MLVQCKLWGYKEYSKNARINDEMLFKRFEYYLRKMAKNPCTSTYHHQLYSKILSVRKMEKELFRLVAFSGAIYRDRRAVVDVRCDCDPIYDNCINIVWNEIEKGGVSSW
jgi:hypothetical protein